MALDNERIRKNIRKLRKLLNKPSKLRAVKGVHDLRTRTRRVEATLRATGLSSKRAESKLLRRLRPIRKKAGKVRDMDVFTAHVLELNPNGERDCVVQLLEYLGEERYRLGDKLRSAVKENAASARSQLKRLAKEMELFTDASGGKSPKSDQSPRVKAAASALQISSELAEPKNLNRGNLHPYRMKVKELRYLLKAAEGGTDEHFIHALGECKDTIGEWHDWEELLAIASDVLDHNKDCKLLDQLRAARQQKFERALSITNQMRRDFLAVRSARGHRPPRKVQRIPPPALKSAGALVQ
jgi:CHAD domain-containing protein